jgi:hypothetical protein
MANETTEQIDPVRCGPCGGSGKCILCKGSGKVLSIYPSFPIPAPGPCKQCSGSGKCVTCDGHGRYRPVRVKRDPVVTPSRGKALCWSCRGTLYCGSCNGGLVLEDGSRCWNCDYGYCLECSGTGEIKADETKTSVQSLSDSVGGFELETCLGQPFYYVKTWTARAAGGTPCVARIAQSWVSDEYGQRHSLRDTLDALLPSLHELVSVRRHPSIAPWTSCIVTAGGEYALVRRFYMTKLESLFSPGPVSPQLLARLAGLAAGIDHLLREAPGIEFNLDPDNLFVDDDGHALLADWGTFPLTRAVASGYDGPRMIQIESGGVVSGVLGKVPDLSPHCGTSGRPASMVLASTYLRMRTGHRGTVDLAELASPHERMVLERALSTDPNDRFPSCSALVAALKAP